MQEPLQTIKAYKLFRIKDGRLYPLFIGRSQETPVGEWQEAKVIPTPGYANRPGWHVGLLPTAPHLMGRNGVMAANRVWAEVLVPADTQWQQIADKSKTRDIRGQVPTGGHYLFQRPAHQGAVWIIAGAMKVVGTLTPQQVDQILGKRWHVYLVMCADGTLYCGITNDLERRISTHNLGRGAKYTRSRLPVRLVWQEPFTTRALASQREYQIKQMTRTEKLEMAGLTG